MSVIYLNIHLVFFLVEWNNKYFFFFFTAALRNQPKLTRGHETPDI